jgi:SAM-dependent methyltransferase
MMFASIFYLQYQYNTTMNNEESKSIHEFDFNLICDYFSSVKRQGPGSEEATLRALQFIEPIDEVRRIADIGCGTGSPTMTLARNTRAAITAVDLFPVFIDQLKANTVEAGLSDRIHAEVGDMGSLNFREGELDLIWCEGAIYNIGFKRGMNEWKKFLRKGGYIAVSEATWFTNERPEEIEDFWNDAYPEIDTVARKVEVMQEAGYIPVATFALPENCWTDHYYAPQKLIQEAFLNKYKGNKTAEELIASQRHEVKMYERYSPYYGYVFYIGKKI